MNIKHLPLFLAAILVLAFAIFGFSRIGLVKQAVRPGTENPLPGSLVPPAAPPAVTDFKNGTYVIDGKEVTLANGHAQTPIAPGSATLLTTKYFGNEAYADLNKDGKSDVVFLLTQDMGGSGTFFYVTVALSSGNGYKGTEAYLIGDRIAPQTTSVDAHDIILVNYADRGAGQAFSDAPREGKTLRLKLDTNTLRFGIVANIVGEADPSRMTLGIKTWLWQSTQLSDKTVVLPKQVGKFSLLFGENNRVAIGTDCNRASGIYTIQDKHIAFSQFVATEMFCANAQEGIFLKELGDVENYLFTDRGELKLMLKNSAGVMSFK